MIGLVLLLCAQAGRAHLEEGWTSASGLVVERAAERAGSYLALCFAPDGELFVADEEAGVLRLVDADHDGYFEAGEERCGVLKAVQGLVWCAGTLYATGVLRDQYGVFALDADPAREPKLVLRTDRVGEHGPHGLALGPDGALYLAIGNDARPVDLASAMARFPTSETAESLPRLPDPQGFGLDARWPYGGIVKIDPASGRAEYVCAGLRNAYDLIFDDEGELFTCDSDMEWDIGLPWYRPVRVLHCVEGGDYGARSGSAMLPESAIDTLPSMCALGRASPTGIEFCRARGLPEELMGALLVADWLRPRILWVKRTPKGASFAGESGVLLENAHAEGLTDLACGPDGSLYFTSGGRKVTGFVRRAHLPKVREPADPMLAAGFMERKQRRALEHSQDADPWRWLASEDRWMRHAARVALLRLGPAGEPNTLERMLLVAETHRDAKTSAAQITELEALFPKLTTPEQRLDGLRVLEIVVQRAETLSPETRAELARFAKTGLMDADEREVPARLGLYFTAREPGWEATVLALFARAPSDAVRIACLRALSAGRVALGAPDAARVLDWFESAARTPGGASYLGYLAELRDPLVQALSVETARALCDRAECGPRTLGALALRLGPDELAARLPRFQQAWRASQQDFALQREFVHVLARTPANSVREWLWQLAKDSNAVTGEIVLPALAEAPRADERARFVAALDHHVAGVRRAAAEALLTLGSASDPLAEARELLRIARKRAAGGGWQSLRVLAACTTGERLSAEEENRPETWRTTFTRVEAAALERWPVLRELAPESPRGPEWSAARILAFLEKSRARAGSPARGREVFVQASCASCHAAGELRAPTHAFPGPELTDAAARLGTRELLTSILEPSRSVSDLYRNTLVVTKDDETIVGRALTADDGGVRLRLADGNERHIAQDEIAERSQPALSPMPAGLLANLSLEEIKDLFAFLEARGVASLPADAAWQGFFSGRRRNGWRYDPTLWQLHDGVLIGKCGTLEHSSYLMSLESFADFEAEFDLFCPTGNSGFQYRSHADESSSDPVGYQADAGGPFWGWLYATDGRGVLHEADALLVRGEVEKPGWNHYFVRVQGEHHVIEVNGLVFSDARDSAWRAGTLGFQLHQGMPMEVRVANARLRPLAP